MKTKQCPFAFLLGLASFMAGCSPHGSMMDDNGMMKNDNRVYPTNGETIFRTGKNQEGVVIQDLARSQMSMMGHGCVNCHGSDGGGGMRMMGRTVPSIKFKDLADPAKHQVPYTEALIKRFLDEELKSDGTPAQTGVAWRLSEQDKEDLIAFLKTLK